MRTAKKLDNHEDSVHFTPPFLILLFFTKLARAAATATEMMITYWNEALERKILCGGRLIRRYKNHIMKYFLSLFMPYVCIYVDIIFRLLCDAECIHHHHDHRHDTKGLKIFE